MKRGYLKVWFCHSVWKCVLEMIEIALHCVIPKSVIAYCFANHISHCLILITVNGFRCFGNTKEETKNKIIEDAKKEKKKEVKNVLKATLQHSF